MNTSKLGLAGVGNINASQIARNTKTAFENLWDSKIFRAIAYILGAIAVLLIFGGTFRVLAWTMIGYNQFASTLPGRTA